MEMWDDGQWECGAMGVWGGGGMGKRDVGCGAVGRWGCGAMELWGRVIGIEVCGRVMGMWGGEVRWGDVGQGYGDAGVECGDAGMEMWGRAMGMWGAGQGYGDGDAGRGCGAVMGMEMWGDGDVGRGAGRWGAQRWGWRCGAGVRGWRCGVQMELRGRKVRDGGERGDGAAGLRGGGAAPLTVAARSRCRPRWRRRCGAAG